MGYLQHVRGITYYNLVSDQFTGLNAVVVPGTLRDSLVILGLLLGQETDLAPAEIMTDTAAYADTVFGLFWLLATSSAPGSPTSATPGSGASTKPPTTAR